MYIYIFFFNNLNTFSSPPIPSRSVSRPYQQTHVSLFLNIINGKFPPPTLTRMQNSMSWDFPILKRNSNANGGEIRWVRRYVALLTDLGGIGSENEAVGSTLDPCFLRSCVAGECDVDVAGCEYYPSVWYVSSAVSLMGGFARERREKNKEQKMKNEEWRGKWRGWEGIYCTAGALCKPPSKWGGMDR